MGFDKWNLVHTFDDGEECSSSNSCEFDEDGLDEVVSRMEDFLRGSGFVFDGHLVIDPCAGCCGCDEEDE